MAEINIQRKERSVWPWLLAGALLLGLLWFLFARNTTDTVAAGADSTAMRDSSAAAGTLAPPDSTGLRRDTLSPPPR